MNWNKVLNVFIIILVVVNLGLFGFDKYNEQFKYVLTNERVEQLTRVMNLKGVQYNGFLSGDVKNYYPMTSVELEAPSADKESIIKRILTDEVPETRMESMPVRERVFTETQSLTFFYGEDRGVVYYEGSGSHYQPKDMTIEAVDIVAKAFAKDMFGEDVVMTITDRKMSNDSFRIEMNEVFNDRIIFQTSIQLQITSEGIKEATAVRYKPLETVGNRESVYPLDEVMYNLIYYLENEEADQEGILDKLEIRDIDLGYYIVDSNRNKLVYEVEPYYRFIFESGEIYYVNGFTNVIYKP